MITMARVRKAKANSVTGIYVPYESESCISFYTKYLMLKAYNQLQHVFLMHIANEQMSSASYTRHLKRMGLVSGVADYLLAVRGGRCAFIEFKRDSKAKQSASQKLFEELVTNLGIPYHLVWDVDEAIKLLQRYNDKC